MVGVRCIVYINYIFYMDMSSEEQWWLITFNKDKSWFIEHDKGLETHNFKSSGLNVILSEENDYN